MRFGKCTDNVLKRSVFKQLNKRRKDIVIRPAPGHGASVMTLPNDEQQMAVQTAVMSGRSEDIGRMIGERAISGLLILGAKPAYMTVDVLMPKIYEENDLKLLMQLLNQTCERYGMEITGGHTEVSPSVNELTVSVTVIGYGSGIQMNKPVAGQDIVMVGWAGYAGASRIARLRSESLYERYHPDFIDDAKTYLDDLSVAKAVETAQRFDVSVIRAVSEGGVFAALWDIAVAGNIGFSVDLKKIPLKQQIVEICDYFDINPYMLYGQGALLIATSQGERLVQTLKDEGIAAAVIGYIQDGHDKCIKNDDEVRYLDLPKGNEFLKIYEMGGE